MDRNLKTALAHFDGKAITILGQIEAEFGNDPEYLAALVELLPSSIPNIENGATWLIKDRLERGEILSEARTDQLAAAAAALTDWQAQLHLAQSVKFLHPSKPAARLLALEMKGFLGHERPFLRAWGLDALVHLSGNLEELRASAEEALKSANEDPAPSVRARARNLGG